jgi:hypothetical protein
MQTPTLTCSHVLCPLPLSQDKEFFKKMCSEILAIILGSLCMYSFCLSFLQIIFMQEGSIGLSSLLLQGGNMKILACLLVCR